MFEQGGSVSIAAKIPLCDYLMQLLQTDGRRFCADNGGHLHQMINSTSKEHDYVMFKSLADDGANY